MNVGDTVTRMLCGTISIKLTVTSITDDLIVCDLWEFDRATGIEIDEYLGWGPRFGTSGSYLVECQKSA